MTDAARKLADRLREAVTVLDEPFHRPAIEALLNEAADALASPLYVGGSPMWLVKFDGKPQAAYSRKVQAEVYSSGFSHLDKIEVVEGVFISLMHGPKEKP